MADKYIVMLQILDTKVVKPSATPIAARRT
jgi:hypothetical protein